MKNSLFILVLISTGLINISCERAPEFPEEPEISFDKVEFFRNVLSRDPESGNIVDQLQISVNFKDGDGNLGLISDDTKDFPYHESTFFKKLPPHDEVYNIEGINQKGGISSNDLLQYGDLDTLPNYSEFSCFNYNLFSRTVITNSDTIRVTDTVYVQPNRNFFNFFVDIYILENGTFKYFDFYKETCIPINGRFIYLNSSDADRPLEGTLTYTFEDANYIENTFRNDTLKLAIQIQDQDLNRSNIVESPPFYSGEYSRQLVHTTFWSSFNKSVENSPDHFLTSRRRFCQISLPYSVSKNNRRLSHRLVYALSQKS